MAEPTLIPQNCITADRDTWPRQGLDGDRVALFVDLYADEGVLALPPLEVVPLDASRFLLTDGWHRLAALRELELPQVAALVVDAGSVDPAVFAYQRGLETCATTSRSLGRAERRAATERLLIERPELTDVAIARLVGVSNATVGRARHRLSDEGDSPTAGDMSWGERGQQQQDHHDVSRQLVRQLDRLWQSRPLLVAAGIHNHARLGDSLAAQLIDTHGPAGALVWAQRFQTWAARATQVTEQASHAEQRTAR